MSSTRRTLQGGEQHRTVALPLKQYPRFREGGNTHLLHPSGDRTRMRSESFISASFVSSTVNVCLYGRRSVQDMSHFGVQCRGYVTVEATGRKGGERHGVAESCVYLQSLHLRLAT